MGLAIVGTDLPILKQNNAILAFAHDDAVLKPESDCIRCGRCAAACPMSLMPTNIVRAAKTKDVDMLKNGVCDASAVVFFTGSLRARRVRCWSM